MPSANAFKLPAVALRALAVLLLASSQAVADIPATEVMTVYRFNAALEIPYYGVEAFRRSGTAVPAGTLTQGSSVVPCLVIREGRPLTDRSGTPFVGFEVVVDSRRATRESTEQFKTAVAARRSMTVTNHHCADTSPTSSIRATSSRWTSRRGSILRSRTPGGRAGRPRGDQRK